MQQDLEHKIRERAYHLWTAEGCRDGESDRYWLMAEREILAEFAASAAPAPKPRARRAANANGVATAKAPPKVRRRASA